MAITTTLDEAQLLDWGVSGCTLWVRVTGLIDNGAFDPQCIEYARVEGEREIDLTDHHPSEWPTTDADVAKWFRGDDEFEIAAD